MFHELPHDNPLSVPDFISYSASAPCSFLDDTALFSRNVEGRYRLHRFRMFRDHPRDRIAIERDHVVTLSERKGKFLLAGTMTALVPRATQWNAGTLKRSDMLGERDHKCRVLRQGFEFGGNLLV